MYFASTVLQEMLLEMRFEPPRLRAGVPSTPATRVPIHRRVDPLLTIKDGSLAYEENLSCYSQPKVEGYNFDRSQSNRAQIIRALYHLQKGHGK